VVYFINRLNNIEVAAGQLKSQAAAASDELHDTQRHLKRLKTPSSGPAAALVASVALNMAGKVVGVNAGEDAATAINRFKDNQDVSILVPVDFYLLCHDDLARALIMCCRCYRRAE
jgi:hypothetical protein